MLRQYILLEHMMRTKHLAKSSERGATAVEYGLLVVLIAAVIVAVVATLGQNILGGFEEVNSKL